MKKLSIFVVAIFVVGLLFLAIPTDADSQALCCQNQSSCFDNDGSGPLPTVCGGQIIPRSSCDVETRECILDATDVPALSAIGSVAVALVLGIAAFIVLHRRKKASI